MQYGRQAVERGSQLFNHANDAHRKYSLVLGYILLLPAHRKKVQDQRWGNINNHGLETFPRFPWTWS